MSREARVLVCNRLSDMATPHVKSRSTHCDLCGAQVWVARSSPPVDHLWCTRCAAKEMGTDERDAVAPITEEQIEDVLDYLYRRGVS
jgi:hypothetical protein